MKNILYFIFVSLSVLVIASCKDEDSLMPGDNESCYEILVSSSDVSATRATYKEDAENLVVEWENGDVIYLGTNEFVFKQMQDGKGLFYHYGALVGDRTKVTFGMNPDDSYTQTQKKNNVCREVLEGDVPADYDYTPGAAGKAVIPLFPAGNKSLVHLQVKSPAVFLGGSVLKIKGLAQQDYNIALGENSGHVFADEGDQLDIYVVVPSGLAISNGTTLKFYFYAYDEDKKNAADGDEYHYYMKCNAQISSLNDKVIKLPLSSRPTHTAIQLGLPSGRKWATTNVGASTETDYGKYYAWGEVEPKDEYSYGTYVNGGRSLAGMSADGIIDADNNLTAQYDAAVQNWGDYWIMPKQKDFKELIDNCTWTWTSSGNAKGYKVTNQQNGKSIFLPAAGSVSGTDKSGEDIVGYYRSSTTTFNRNRWVYGILFNSSSNNADYTEGERFKGLPVRPVVANSNDVSEKAGDRLLSGVFSVSATKKVRFSSGNLQYQASTGTWRFAKNQFDMIGLDNSNISPAYDGWIDLFGWGTSGWESGAKAYQPYSISMENSDYYPGNKNNISLVGNYAKADWGVYNAISNGGNKAGLWRSLTRAEAVYLIGNDAGKTNVTCRKNAASLRAKATINGVLGAIFFPDAFEKPDGIEISMSSENQDESFQTNTYTMEEWDVLEYLGAVFLPCGGYRKGTEACQLGEYDKDSYDSKNYTAAYWTSNHKNATFAYNIVFKNKNTKDSNYKQRRIRVDQCDRKGGNNVRLVQEVK